MQILSGGPAFEHILVLKGVVGKTLCRQARRPALWVSLPWLCIRFSSENNEVVELDISKLLSSIEFLVRFLTSITLSAPFGCNK